MQVGEKVMMYDPATNTGECPKLKKRWKGPFMVVECSVVCSFLTAHQHKKAI